jgi:hypothetical protein
VRPSRSASGAASTRDMGLRARALRFAGATSRTERVGDALPCASTMTLVSSELLSLTAVAEPLRVDAVSSEAAERERACVGRGVGGRSDVDEAGVVRGDKVPAASSMAVLSAVGDFDLAEPARTLVFASFAAVLGFDFVARARRGRFLDTSTASSRSNESSSDASP